MSWEEYKKKREQESSWAKYKQQRDYERQQKEKAQIEQKKLLEKINLPTKEIKSNQTVVVPNANSKNNNMTNIRNSMATSLSQQFSKATTTKNKGIVTSVDDIINRIKADEKNKNIAKGGEDAFNEYMDSTLNAIPGGTMSVFSGIADAGTSLAGAGVKGLQNLTNNENVEEKLQETYDKIINIGKNIRQRGNATNLVNSYVENDFTRESSNVVHTISSQLTTYGLSLATGLPAPLIQGTYVGGSSAQEVLNENKDNAGRAVLTGVGKGLTSYGVEKFTGGNILGKGSFDDGAVKFIAENFKSKTGQKIASKIYEVGGEVIEENLENAIDMVIDNVVNQKGYTVKDWWNELGETSKGTILATIALNLLGLGGDTYNKVQEYKLDSQAKNMIKEAETLIEKENLKIDFDKMKQHNKNTTTNLQLQSTQNTQNTPNQQIMPTQQKNAQNTNMKTNKMLPMQNYVYEKSDNVKIDKFRQSASQNFDNSIESRNYLNMLEKIITDKDVDIIFDANLKDSQGRVANGSYSNGVITINPNSNRAGEFIAIHELTHAIGTNQMRNIVEQYRKSNKAFDSAVQQLLKNYNTTELTEEAMADVSAQLFGNQEFINTLAQREPNLFRKIYNEIKYLWHQFTGYKNQNQFIEDLQYKWEQAYRNNNKLNETTNYSVAGKKALENIKDAQLRKKAYDTYKEAKQMAKKKANNEEIFNKTGWYKDKVTGKMKFNFSDKDMQIVNRNYKIGQEFDLQDILVHKTLFEMYPQLKTYKVKIEDINLNNANADGRLNGKYNRFTNELTVDVNRFKKIANVEGTLIHEIQHAIQKIEGFAGGTSIRFGKEKYKNNPGEREARDTARRMQVEKYHQKDLSNVMPKSANIDATILEKMKIGLYNYLSSINNEGEYNETYEIHQKENLSTDSKDNGLVLGGGYRPNGRGEKLLQRYINNTHSFSIDNQGRTLTKEQQEYFKDSKVRNKNGNLITMYHGTDAEFNEFTYENYGKTGTAYGKGFYFTDSKEAGQSYGKNLKEVYLDIKKPMEIGKTTMSKTEFKKLVEVVNKETEGIIEADYGSLEDAVMEYDYGGDDIDLTNSLMNVSGLNTDRFYEILRNTLGYDGIKANNNSNGKDGNYYLAFNSNQIKNVDNKKPTNNPDIRYSLPTKEWQQYLDENYKTSGTRTNLSDIRLPIKKNSEKSSFSMPTKQNTIKLPQKETNVEKYNRYKQNILKGRAEEVNNLIKNKNETINAIEEQIKKKTQELNSKADKTTKVANNLKMQIENLKQRKTKIENEYNSRIDRKFDKVSKDKINLETKKELGITRKEIQQNLLEDSGIISESLDNAQNISMANMNRTDPIRLQEKVFGRELGTKINNMFFNKIKHNTAEKTRFLNSERNDIKNWEIKARSFESEVLQKYTEKTYVTGAGKEISYTEADLIKDVPNEETRNKIKKASEELRKKYDNYIERANEVLVGLGYDAIPKRKDYVRHFTELNDIFTKFGIPGKLDNALPTDINGITDTFRPGKNFFANAQKRHGNKTTYDAITGIDGYIEGISNLIYHTEDIQRLRALDKYIRESYGEKGFENLENLSEEERNARIQKISENHLSNYVSWLTEYTNNLAGKKSGIDRSVEKLLGRNVYSALDTIKKQTGSNMTGFNIGSALTNFISVTQGASKTKKLALLKGTARTIQNIFNNDGFVDKSDFLTNRFGSDRISNTLWQKVSNVGQVFMSATDYFSSNLIVRSKYYENLAKGMSESEALKKADDFGARILGDRSQGSTANVFNSKMLGILTQFQLEVNNQMDTMIHDTVQDFKTIEGERGALKASMGAVWTLGQMAAYQYIFNNIFQAIAGRRPAFDVIDILKTALGIDDEDEEDSVKDNLQEAAIKLIEGLPFLNLLSEDARVPIASAIPNPISVATGDSTLKDEVSKLVYLLPPTGGSQAKKTIDGVKTVMDGGSYVINSKGEKELRFPVEDKNALSYIKAGTLGKYSLPLAQEYVDRDYKRLSAKQTKTYEESKVPFKEYLEYIEAGLKTNEDKINYLESKEMNTEQKWRIYTNDLFSSTERKKDGGSQLSDAKYITSNGVSKNEYISLYNIAQKNNIDMPTADEYKEMKSNDITLKSYIEYKMKVKELTESKRKSEELSETENLKKADKIQILLDSNYSNKEISGIYANYIRSEKDSEYDIMKATEIDIKEYLKYKQQEFESDKEDDGTLAGKTVSKSKQKKVVEYLNSMNIKGNQRLLLYAMQGYSMTSAQKTQLVNYVKGLKIDKDTKLELYDKFSGFTVYKDGTIKY